jgi:hypothetical protein
MVASTEALFLRELVEIPHHFLDQQAARLLIGRTSLAVVRETPFLCGSRKRAANSFTSLIGSLGASIGLIGPARLNDWNPVNLSPRPRNTPRVVSPDGADDFCTAIDASQRTNRPNRRARGAATIRSFGFSLTPPEMFFGRVMGLGRPVFSSRICSPAR